MRSSIQAAMALNQGQRSASVSGTPARIFSMLERGWKSSPSAKRQCRFPASKAPTVVLPLPDTPATMSIMPVKPPHHQVHGGPDGLPSGDTGLRVDLGRLVRRTSVMLVLQVHF